MSDDDEPIKNIVEDDENEPVLKIITSRHVPAWFAEMNGKITNFVDQNTKLEQGFKSNQDKINEFNQMQKNEKRRKLNEKYGEKIRKLKVTQFIQFYHLPITILYKILLFCGDTFKTYHKLCRASKRIAILFFQNIKLWKSLAQPFLPKALIEKNSKISNWRPILKLFVTEYKNSLIVIDQYQKMNCPKKANKVISQSLIKFTQFVQNNLCMSFNFGSFHLVKQMLAFLSQPQLIYIFLRLMTGEINVARQHSFDITLELASINYTIQQKVRGHINWRKQLYQDDQIILDDYQKARIGLMFFTQHESFEHPVILKKSMVETKFTLALHSFASDHVLIDKIIKQDGYYRGVIKHHFQEDDSLYFDVILENDQNNLKGYFEQENIGYPIQVFWKTIDYKKQDVNIFRQGNLLFTLGKRQVTYDVYLSLIRQNDRFKVIIYGNSDQSSILLINENVY